MTKLKVSDCHLAAPSFAGVDARAAIGLYGANRYVKSLTTICSPHLGMKLIDTSLEWQNKTNDDEYFLNLEKVFEIVGLTNKSALEFSTHNIADFNEFCEDG